MKRHCVKWSGYKKTRRHKTTIRSTCKTIHLKGGKTVRRPVYVKASGQWRFLSGKC